MNYALEVKNLSKEYKCKNKKIKALDDISFNVNKGEIYGLLGPNGAGKTTLIKSICNLIIPDSGYIKINEISIHDNNKAYLKKISAILEGNKNLYWRLTPIENLKYFAGIRGIGGKELNIKIDETLQLLNLIDQKNKPVNYLSTGMKQRLIIAVGLICDTDIILLDEPTLGLDVKSRNELSDILKKLRSKYNKTILVSSHDMEFIQGICDRCLIVNNGKIITENSVENLLGMFNSVNYTFELIEPISKDDEYIVQSNYPSVTFNENRTSINLNWDKNNNICNLFDFFKQHGIHVKMIEKNEINLEKVFVDLTMEVKDGTNKCT